MKDNALTLVYVFVGIIILLTISILLGIYESILEKMAKICFGICLICLLVLISGYIYEDIQMKDDKKEIKQEENKFLNLSELEEAGYDVYVNGEKKSGEIRLDVWEYKCEVQIDDENKQIWIRTKLK